MKNVQSKHAFTMIELIFVIVILGILAAVAVPKLIGTKNSAEAQTVESFVGTMNRTTFPSMYVSALRDGGSITSFTLDDFISLPGAITSLDISSCGTGSFVDIGDTSIGADIYCQDGNGTNLPLLSFSSSELNSTLASSYFR